MLERKKVNYRLLKTTYTRFLRKENYRLDKKKVITTLEQNTCSDVPVVCVTGNGQTTLQTSHAGVFWCVLPFRVATSHIADLTGDGISRGSDRRRKPLSFRQPESVPNRP